MVRRLHFFCIEGDSICFHFFTDHIDGVFLCGADRTAAVEFALQAFPGNIQHAECQCQLAGLLIAHLDPESFSVPVTVRHQAV